MTRSGCELFTGAGQAQASSPTIILARSTISARPIWSPPGSASSSYTFLLLQKSIQFSQAVKKYLRKLDGYLPGPRRDGVTMQRLKLLKEPERQLNQIERLFNLIPVSPMKHHDNSSASVLLS